MRERIRAQNRAQGADSVRLARSRTVAPLPTTDSDRDRSRISALPAGHDFSQVAVHARTTDQIQAKLAVNVPGDKYEEEAERLAQQVMRMGDTGGVEPVRTGVAGTKENGRSPLERSWRPPDADRGIPLSGEVRAFMEPRFGADFSRVRVHTDTESARLTRSLDAQAFVHGRDIYFGAGKIPGKDALTAHELSHVVQQTGRPSLNGPLRPPHTDVPAVQRVVELRPPGRGEASAFERREELVARLNAQSVAIEYCLEGGVLEYTVNDEAGLKNFDRQMMQFIDAAPVLPLRLITSAGLELGNRGYQNIIGDSFPSGYADLDDLLATDDLAFQSNLVHILAERLATKNYDRRIGTKSLTPEAVFDPGHAAGHEAQAKNFQDVFDDPSIKYNYEELKPHGIVHVVFQSPAKGYWIFLIYHRVFGNVTSSEVKVRKGGRWLTVDEFLATAGSD